MRWLPWQRRGNIRAARPAPGLAAAPAPWRRLPPLATAVRRPSLTLAASMGVFATDRLRPLILAPRHGRSAARQAFGPTEVPAVAEPGHVTGLVSVRGEAPPEQPPVAQPRPRFRRRAPLPEHVQAPDGPSVGLRLTPRVLAAPGPRPSLLKARDEYVGEAVPDAVPHTPSAWLRTIESYRPPWVAEAPGVALPQMPEGGGSLSSEAVVAPPRPSRATPTEAPKAARRASLAESRRLGLGNPLRQPAAPALGASTDSPTDSSDPLQVGEEQAPEPASSAPSNGDADEDPVANAQWSPLLPVPETAVQGAMSTAAPEEDQLGLAAPIQPVRVPRSTPPDRPTDPGPRLPDPDGIAAHSPGGSAARRAAPRMAGPVYRFVPGERPTPFTEKAVHPIAPAPAPPTATTPRTRAVRPLTHPPAGRAPDVARIEPEQQLPPAPSSPPVESAPSDLADAVRRAHGVDVSDVPIHRGPEAAAEARALGARAFTRDGEVYLPAQEGPLDQPVAHGLLAHELTHAAQQRALGSALPPEGSAAGSTLEAAAVATERWARGLGPAPAASGPAPAEQSTPPVGASWTAPWQPAAVPGVQRQADDVANPSTPIAAGTPSALDPAITPIAAIAAGAPSAFQQPTAPQPPALFDAELRLVRDRLIELSKRRPLDLDDPGDIEELAIRVYQKIHRRLRRELLVDRERAGRLSETGPFGWAR